MGPGRVNAAPFVECVPMCESCNTAAPVTTRPDVDARRLRILGRIVSRMRARGAAGQTLEDVYRDSVGMCAAAVRRGDRFPYVERICGWYSRVMDFRPGVPARTDSAPDVVPGSATLPGLYGEPVAAFDAPEPSEPGRVVCTSCREEVDENDSSTAPDGCVMCEECYGEQVSYCEGCSESVFSDDVYSARRSDRSRNGEQCRCADCSFVCDGCNDRFYGDSYGEDGDWCADCHSERFSWCEGCSSECDSDEMREVDGEYYCRSCAAERSNDSDLVHDYSYKPRAVFHAAGGVESGRAEPGVRYYGLEVETELPRRASQTDSAVESAIRRVTDSDLWYAKNDASLSNGVEFVSHPCTIQAWREIGFGWADDLAAKKWRSHDTTTCGIHVHISRAAMTETQWVRLAKFFRDNRTLIRRAARRDHSDYAAIDPTERNTAISAKVRGQSGDRYTAVNFCPRNTVEIRVFKGTLRPSSILRYVEFVNAVCEYVTVCGSGKSGLSEARFRDWLRNTGQRGRAADSIGEGAAKILADWLFPGPTVDAAADSADDTTAAPTSGGPVLAEV